MPYIGLNHSYVPSEAEQSYMDHPAGQMGPTILGTVLSWMLLGVLLTQTLNYFMTFKADRWAIKAHVVLVVVLNILFDITLFMQCWYHFIMHFGDWIVAITPPWFQKIEPLVATIIDVVTQMFFVSRAFKLSHRNWYFLVITVSCLIISFAGALMEYIVLIIGTTGRGLFVGIDGDKLNKGVELNLSFAMAADLLITGTTAYYLLTSRSGFKSTDSLIWKLLRILMLSAVPPLLFQIGNLATHRMSATTLITVFFNMCIPKLYAISMMYTLNIRAELRQVPSTSQQTPTAKDKSTNSGKPALSVLRILRKEPSQTNDFAMSVQQRGSVDNIHVDAETYVDHSYPSRPDHTEHVTFGDGTARGEVERDNSQSPYKRRLYDDDDTLSVRSKQEPI